MRTVYFALSAACSPTAVAPMATMTTGRRKYRRSIATIVTPASLPVIGQPCRRDTLARSRNERSSTRQSPTRHRHVDWKRLFADLTDQPAQSLVPQSYRYVLTGLASQIAVSRLLSPSSRPTGHDT